jgi:hypothetical protein
MQPILATVTGGVLIGVALRDVFQTLFQPSGRGRLSRLVTGYGWRAFRVAARRLPSLLAFAGPALVVGVTVTWVLLLTLGWALLYWPRLPDAFLVASGLVESNQRGFVDAFYVSLVTIATLGYGDIAPEGGWLRIAGPAEALVGFAVLTAVISWVLSIYGTLARRHSFARELALLRQAEAEVGIAFGNAGDERVCQRLSDFADRVIRVRSDLVDFPDTYYFRPDARHSSLADALPYLVRLAEENELPARPNGVRLHARVLRLAIEDFADLLADRFLRCPKASTIEVLTAYATDHLRLQPARIRWDGDHRGTSGSACVDRQRRE